MTRPARAIYAIFFLSVWSCSACSRYSDIASSDVHVISTRTYSEISYSKNGKFLIALGGRSPPGGYAPTYVVDASSGKRELILSGTKYYEFPTLSMFDSLGSVTTEVTSIELIDLGRRVTMPLMTGEGAIWLRDRPELAVYVGTNAHRQRIHRQIQIVDVHGNVLRQIELPPGDERALELSTGYSEYYAGMDVSPDSSQLIVNLEIHEGYETRRTRYESYLVNLSDGQYELVLEGKHPREVTWSSDKEWVAYIDVDFFIEGNLMLHNLSKDCDVVAPFPPEIRSPTWSSDGLHLAFIYKWKIHVWDVQSWMDASDSDVLCR